MIKNLLVLMAIVFIFPLQAGKINRGFRQLEKSNYDRALQLFEEALEDGEKSPVLYFGLAKLYSQNDFELKNFKEAYKNIIKAYEESSRSFTLLKEEDITVEDIASLRSKIESSLLNDYLQSNSVNDLNLYIRSFPDALNLNEAIRWRNQLAFEEAQDVGTAKAYSDFIEKYPEAEETELAERQKSKLSYIELLEKEKELDKAIKEKVDAENRALVEKSAQQKSRITFLIVVMVVIFGLLGFSIFSFIKIKKANIAIKEQKDTIEEKNQQILDSIRYAKFIQDAILPKESLLKKYFSDAFIFFRPRDIVSGDFYWFAETDDCILVAAVDCTGHGVPGAFMSMIGHTLLNQIVHIKKIHRPSEILFELRKEVIKSLNQKESDNFGRDGMDMALVSLNKKTLNLEFSGAYNPLYIVQGDKLEQIKADRQPIAIHFKKTDTPFTNHSFQLRKGDQLYIFSDGYPDQFGGPKNKKYSYRRFRDDLLGMEAMKAEEQKDLLSKNIDQWMVGQKPIDDMLVIGLKV